MTNKCSHADHCQHLGYAIIRNVFDNSEIRELGRAFDEIHAFSMNGNEGLIRPRIDCQFSDDPMLGRILRIARWPSYCNDILDKYRVDIRLLEILEPLIGNNIKQVVNQLHWKPAKALKSEFGYHQDIGFRRPRKAYRNVGHSYVQMAIAIDPHRTDTGPIRVYPGSHRLGRLVMRVRGRVMENSLRDQDLYQLGLDPETAIDLLLDPGDVALWNVFTIHGSGPNSGNHDRRAYINGYMKASDCDIGEWAFRNGRPHRLFVEN